MMEPSSDQQARLQVMVADMAAVLDFPGWQAVHAAVMSGKFSTVDAPVKPVQPRRSA
jgi:hypothetical protein